MHLKQTHRTKSNLSPRFSQAIMLILILLGSIDASATRRYVDASSTAPTPDGLSWATAYTKFEDAVTAAVSGDVIWVAKGTYQPAFEASYTLKAGVEIYGGFTNTDTDISQRDWEANVTKLKGNGNSVFYIKEVRNNPVLDGFTICEGINRLDYAGGMCILSSSPTLRNLIIRDNLFFDSAFNPSLYPFGAGMFNFNSTTVLTNVKFIDNICNSATSMAIGGGLANVFHSSVVMNDVVFSGNKCISANNLSLGGGMANDNQSSAVLNNVTFSDNKCISANNFSLGGGMANNNQSSAVLNNVIFSDNKCISSDGDKSYAYGAGFYCSESSLTLDKVVFSKNVSEAGTGTYGGAVYIAYTPTDKPSLLTNVVFDQNSALYGAAVYCKYSTVTMAHATASNNIGNYSWCYAFTGVAATVTIGNSVFYNNRRDLFFSNPVSTAVRNSFINPQGTEITPVNSISSDFSPFLNEGVPAGPDGIWMTADDGLRLVYDAVVTPIDKAETITSELYSASVVSASGTDIRGVPRPQGAANDMGAYEGGVDRAIIYVDVSNTSAVHDGTSWSTAFNKLEDALDPTIVGSGGSVWVAKGTYQPEEGKSFMMLPLSRIYGGFKNTDTEFEQRDWVNNQTILQGNGSHVIKNVNSGVDPPITGKSELDGFTITGGNGGATGGGGMYNYRCSPTISNSIFDQNETDLRGGAVYNDLSSPWFRNVSFTGNSSNNGDGGAIYNNGGSTAYDNVIFSNNKADNGYGGAVVADRVTMVMNNAVFESNHAANGGAISSIQSTVDITNSVFVGNQATTSSAVMYNTGIKLHITHATFLNNIATDELISEHGASIYSYTSIINSVFKGGAPIGSYPVVSYTTLGTVRSGIANEVKTTDLFVNENLPKGADGIWFTEDDGLQLAYDVDTSPATAINSGKTVVEADGNTSITDVALKDITGFPRPSGMGYDKGAYEYRYPVGVASHLYVDASNTADPRDGKTWGRAYNNLDLALADPLLTAGNELWVAKGTYQPASGSSFVMKEGVGIYGGLLNTHLDLSERDPAANPTILKGNGKSVIDNTFTEPTALTGTAVLDGFTIQDGTSSILGGGIRNTYASPTLQNLIIKNNSATSNGGGIALDHSSSQLMNVRIEGNQARIGAGMDITNSSPSMINVVFKDNNAGEFGGGINSTSSSYDLLNAVFDGNKVTGEWGAGGGVFSSGESGPTIFKNVIFYDNKADFGGGISGESPVLTNATFYKNIGNFGGGATNFYSQTADVAAITNSVFWGNTDGDNDTATPDLYFPGQDITANYNFTQSDFSSGRTGNIQGTSSPFVNEAQPMGPDGIWFTEDDGLQLSVCSPALDKGSNDAASEIYIDVLEQPRKHNTTVDMGAYEKQSNTKPDEFASNAALSLNTANDLPLLPTCEDNGWTFYADPTKPDNFIFAIDWSTGNEAAKATATVKITLAENNTAVLDSDKGIVAMRRYWNVDLHATTLVNPVKVRFYYDTADVTAMESTVSDASLFMKNNEVKWFKTTGNLYVPTQITATDINTGARLFLTPAYGTDNGIAFAQFNEVTSFSGGTAVILAEKEPSLPVTLISFQGKNTEPGSNLLTWKTAAEKDFSHFEIEHSLNGTTFTVLGNVQGQNTGNYQYTHANPPFAVNYYRLRMVDLDGSFAYSRMISVANNQGVPLAGSIYPNPAASGKNSFIDFNVNEAGTWQTQIFSTSGILLKSGSISLQPGFNKIMIDVKGLPEGIHLVRFRDQYQREVVRKLVIE